ncbi:MAG TPA: hypothetical protein ENJ84_13880 [Gammaproteobacteria bacterium]|nr:hypothetical protein [Gammaproteobacteria bacterium]
MVNLFFSLVVAAIFGVSASAYYGSENLWQYPWVETATWAIVGAGVLSETLCILMSNNLCSRAKWLRMLVCHSSECRRTS